MMYFVVFYLGTLYILVFESSTMFLISLPRI